MKEAISAFVPSTINWNIGVDAHILVAFLAYRLIVTLKHRARPVCAGTDAARRAGKAGLDSDARRDPVHHRWPPTGMPRHTELETDLALLLHHLNLTLPPQPPPRISQPVAENCTLLKMECGPSGCFD